MIWNETKECMSRDEMTNLQSARLRKLVDRVYHSVEYYRKKMQAVGFEKEDWLKVIETTVPPKTVEINKKAFETGYALSV